MQKIGCLMLAVCMWGAPVVASPLETAVERQVLSYQQAQYNAKNHFVTAVESFQFNAKYNTLDEEGFVKGVFDLAQAYHDAVKGHSRLYAIELAGYMDRQMARPWNWENRTITSYVLKSLKKKAKRADAARASMYKEVRSTLQLVQKNRRTYFPAMWELAIARGNVAKLKLDAGVARAEVTRDQLTAQQVNQVADVVAQLKNAAKVLSQAQPEVWQIVAEGLRRDPLLASGTPIRLDEFLIHYGMYSSHQEDGALLVKVGQQLSAAAN